MKAPPLPINRRAPPCLPALILWMLGTALPAAAAVGDAGRISLVEGNITITEADGTPRTPVLNGPIAAGDTITTGADGELQAEMEDGGMIAVRPDSVFRIDAYRADGDSDDESVFTLLKGAVRSVTGYIGKVNTANYEVRTPTATIGVRGTDHEVLYITEDEAAPDETPGTHDRVYSGETVIRTAEGSLDLKAGEAGYVDARQRGKLRRHQGIPRFMERRRTRHEALIEKHGQKSREIIERKLRTRGKLKDGESLNDFIQRKRTDRLEHKLEHRHKGDDAHTPRWRDPDNSRQRDHGSQRRKPAH